MARKEFTKTAQKYLDELSAKKTGAINDAIDAIYDRVVDAVDIGEHSIPISDEEMAFIPAVNQLLLKPGFKLSRYFGGTYAINVVK